MNIDILKNLKDAQELLNEQTQSYELLRNNFEEKHKFLTDSIKETNGTIEYCKDILRENAEAGYNKDGVKKRLGGVGIRCMKVLEYDNNIALKWAKEKDLFLQLDKKSFENVAKTGEIDFVEVKEKVTVTFPKLIIID